MKILWVGDAVVDTGFSRVTHNVCSRLKDKGHDVSILGVNYFGDPHSYPFDIYVPHLVAPEDIFGFKRIWPLALQIKPDIICIMNDAYIVAQYMQDKPVGVTCPIVGYMPVDGQNVRYDIAMSLNYLDMAILYTVFGETEITKAGYCGATKVIPHGVDSIYSPSDKRQARRAMGVPESLESAFIFGNVNRNQPRKRLDLTVEYFAEFLHTSGATDAYLYLHCTEEDVGIRPGQLCKYYGIDHRLIMPGRESLTPAKGVSQTMLSYIYNSFDVHISTTAGEGWGLSTLESMACGIPNIIPDWSALGEWPQKKGCLLVPCSSTWVFPGGVNTVGGLANRDLYVDAMMRMYTDEIFRNTLGKEARCRANALEFNWGIIVGQFETAFEEAKCL